MKIEILIKELIEYKEAEWLEFKDSWFDPHEIGEYISALSNSASIVSRKTAYLIWGIDDKNKNIIGTTFDYEIDVKGEPFEHYLARQLNPSITFRFYMRNIEGKKVVVLEIPAAIGVPTTFDKERYIRIGSSKEKLSKYPEREAYLWSTLSKGIPSIVNTETIYQDLTFSKLFVYYGARGITLKSETFEENLKLKTSNGKYNVLGRLLADENNLPIRVSIFSGKNKADKLYSVKEYGNTCILYSLDRILEFGETINVIQADERERVIERKDIPFFDQDAFREAILNAFVHNDWVAGNAPMITIFTDRIEILSHGGLPSNQTLKSFFEGTSKPVNEQLATIFLQLRISERSGRGVPKVVDVYGKNAFSIDSDSIKVTIPFNKINVVDFQIESEKVKGKVESKVEGKINGTQKSIILEMRNNPNITIPQLANKLSLSEASINKNIRTLKNKTLISRVGADKNGYWAVIK